MSVKDYKKIMDDEDEESKSHEEGESKSEEKSEHKPGAKPDAEDKKVAERKLREKMGKK